jgi:outer membrane protein assembly factor BamB
MKKYFVWMIFFFSASVFGQQLKFAVIANPEISDIKSAAILDSAIVRINSNDEIKFIVAVGNLTQNGNFNEVEIFKNSIEKSAKQIILLPGSQDMRDAKAWEALQEIASDKFEYKENGILFVGLSSFIPFTKLSHYTLENLDWIKSVLDTVKINDEFYFFASAQFENKIDNWKNLISLFYDKSPQLIFNVDAPKLLLRNVNGFNILDVPGLSGSQKNQTVYFVCELNKDSIKIKDQNDKLISSINKSIKVEKDSIKISDVENYNTDILMRSELKSTMLTSADYWNGKIYTSDQSGLISCLDSTGQVLWDYDTNGNVLSKPVIADRMITAATYQGDITTISAINGEQIQSIGFEETITSDLSVINYDGTKELMIPKLSKSNSAIVFGTASGKVFCYDLETLQQYWVNSDAKGMILSKSISSDNKIFFTSRDGFLYCIDARDGLLIWRWKEKENTDLSDSRIYTNGKKVFVVSGEGTVYAINLLLGKLEWKADKLNAMTNFGISNDKLSLYIPSKAKSFYILNAENGRTIKEIKMQDNFSEALDCPIEAGNNILFSINGVIYSMGNKFNLDKLLFIGTAPAHTLINITDNKFLASNIDGRIIIFNMR